MRLRARFAAAFIGHTCLLLLLIGATSYMVEERVALSEQRSRHRETVEKLASVCRIVQDASSAIFALDFMELLKREPAIVFAACIDPQGLVQAHSDPRWIGRAWPEPRDLERAGSKEISVRTSGRLLTWYGPVSLRGLQSHLAVAAYDRPRLRKELRERIIAKLRRPALVAASAFPAAVLIGLVLAWSLSRPIGQLARASRTIGLGNWDIHTPISERGDELGALAREMDAMARRLKVLDQLKDEFISHVSHELRNPMAAIKMFAGEMLRGDDRQSLSPRHREMLLLVEDNAARLNIFVSNVLDAAKMKAGRMEYHPSLVPVDAMIERVLALFNILAAQKKVSLSRGEHGASGPVYADPERLEHAVNNLVSNALKFTRSGGSVVVGTRRNEDATELYVRDDGKGIPADAMKNLFKPFHQADVAEQRAGRIQGSGLGLYIVKQTVEAMGGSVRVQSAPGQGTTVTLLFHDRKAS